MASNKLTGFLERNKVYFEVFSYIILGVMGVIVSYNQLQTASAELAIHRRELLPLFRIDYEQLKTDSTGKYDTDVLRIFNDGRPIRQFEPDIRTFYFFEMQDMGSPIKEGKRHVEVADYYSSHFRTNQLSGELLTAFSYNNNAELAENYWYAHSLFKKKKLFVHVTKQVFYKFSYIDINNERHVEYLNTAGHGISEDEYAIVCKKDRSGERRIFSMSEIDERFIDSLASVATGK